MTNECAAHIHHTTADVHYKWRAKLNYQIHLIWTGIKTIWQELELLDWCDSPWQFDDAQQLLRFERPDVDEARPTTTNKYTTIPL